jgi:hypothetical protein
MKFLKNLGFDKSILAEKNFNLICTVVLVVLLSYFLLHNKELFDTETSGLTDDKDTKKETIKPTDICENPQDPITKIDCMTQRAEIILKGLEIKEKIEKRNENTDKEYKFFTSCKTK